MHRLLAFQQRSLRLEPLRSPSSSEGDRGGPALGGFLRPSTDLEYEYWLDWSLPRYAYRQLPSPLGCLLCSHIDSNPSSRTSMSGLVDDNRIRSL